MSVRILYDADREYAVLYCSTSMWAFGPVFTHEPTTDEHERMDAQDLAQSFLDWLETTANFGQYEQSLIGAPRRDARLLTEAGLSAAYADWLVYVHQENEVQS